MNKIITFSIAAYNIEKYIDKLMKSLLEKDLLDDIEILIINDGSVDKTAFIAKLYQERYPNTVRLINKKNGGHGSTINIGISLATGKYFKAIDGDDWVNTKDVIRLVKILKNIDINLDMILTNYYKCYESGEIKEEILENLIHNKIYRENDLFSLIKNIGYHNIIYKTKLLQDNNIRLDEKCFYVDTEYIIYPLIHVHTILFLNYKINCYRLGTEEQSVNPKNRMKNIRDSYIVSKALLKFYKKIQNSISDEKRKYIRNRICGMLHWHISGLLMFKPTKEKKDELINFDKLIKKYSEEMFFYMENKKGSSKLMKLLRWSNYKIYYFIVWYKQIKNNIKKFLKK